MAKIKISTSNMTAFLERSLTHAYSNNGPPQWLSKLEYPKALSYPLPPLSAL